jgi:hypothetical protein
MTTLNEKLEVLKASAEGNNDHVINWCTKMLTALTELESGAKNKTEFLEFLEYEKAHGPQIGAMTQQPDHMEQIDTLYLELSLLGQ